MGVLVVGAGPAGLRVAEQLSSGGETVLVLEQRQEIPWKACSGLVSAGTVRLYGLDDVVENVIHGARIHAGGATVSVDRVNVACVLNRRALDNLLLDRAESSGAEVRFGVRYDGPGLWGADVLVGADGFASTVRFALGLRPPRYVMGAVGAVKGEFDGYVDVYLDRALAPGFFAWVIPRSDSVAELGIGVDAKHSSEVIPRLRAFSRQLGLGPLRVLGARPIPVDFPMGRVVYGNVALVGDAAIQTKATTGGGISYGLLAADALAEAVLSGDLHGYQRYHRYRLFPRLVAHALIRKYLDSVCPERLLLFLREQGIEKKLSERGDMDDPAFLLTSDFLPFIFRSVFLLI